MKKLLVLPAALLLSSAMAAPKISAQSIIVNPVQPDLSVSVWTDKNPDGTQIPNYKIDEKITLNVRSSQDAYVYLFNVDGTGKVDQLLPNRYANGANFVKANVVKTFPAAGDQFTFDIAGPVGLNKVLVLASKTELNLGDLSKFSSQQDSFADVNAKGQQQLAQALSIVVSPIPQNSWVSDTAFYNVASQQQSQTGNVFVGTNVSGAVVYLNGQRLGDANQTFSAIRPGSYPLKITAPGYRDYSATITVRANATTNVNVEFNTVVTPAPPVSNTAAVNIRSSVNGALIFVDGRQVGTIQNGGLDLNLPRGGHEIVLIAPGYNTFVNNYNVSQGGTITITPKR
ncbi:PEGA domain-containing protein [Deinococcus psychrotolerans]|uniref:PEGA domain-containing protein n=1 Tax=Deinococcus psychrotolerans TaxID=2489213 RepID=A0A3G8YCJ5_9DEIO|nr:DUF4384 domain-containing protein [Deinococcus psychrotolerans]AZI43109.1 PEGA domain-containing protein [Deinococcus psychrotolerans]